MAWGKMVDLALTDEDREEAMTAMAPESRPSYPYGACIRLSEREIEKLGLGPNIDIGDVIDLRAFGEVTAVSKSSGSCSVEIQLQRMSVENENAEDPDDEAGEPPARARRRYGKGR